MKIAHRPVRITPPSAHFSSPNTHPQASGIPVAPRPEQIRSRSMRPSVVHTRACLPTRNPATKPTPVPHSRWRAIDSTIPNPLVFEPRHDAPHPHAHFVISGGGLSIDPRGCRAVPGSWFPPGCWPRSIGDFCSKGRNEFEIAALSKVMPLAGAEFVRRFTLHVLPRHRRGICYSAVTGSRTCHVILTRSVHRGMVVPVTNVSQARRRFLRCHISLPRGRAYLSRQLLGSH